MQYRASDAAGQWALQLAMLLPKQLHRALGARAISQNRRAAFRKIGEDLAAKQGQCNRGTFECAASAQYEYDAWSDIPKCTVVAEPWS